MRSRPGEVREEGAFEREPEPAASTRNLAIDRLRGALVILMVGGDFLGGVQLVPAYLKHAPDLGLTLADLVAPCFLFIIGVNYGPSFARRVRLDPARAYRHFFLRNLALIGIGAIISAGATSVAGTPTDWGVLQALGVAGLITLAFIRLPTVARFIIGFLLLVGYQWMLDAWVLESVIQSNHGGFIGALSWSAMLILSTAVADVRRAGSREYLICCGALVVVAAISLLVVPVSKHRVSLSFVLVTLALSALVLLIVELGSRFAPERAGLLSWWGENALALYLLHLVVLAIVVVPPVDWWYSGANAWLASLQLVSILAAMSAAAWWLHRRSLLIRL